MAATSFRTLLDAAMAQARSAPADPSARMKLFRLFCVSGQWDRAATQADTGSNLDAELGFTTLVYKQALACEKFRADVFAGTRVPVIAGEPPQWLALMLEALRAEAGGDPQARSRAAQLRGQAMEGAQAVAGTLNGQAFEWVADADPRLGPVCECFIDGKYYWVPFDRIARIELPEHRYGVIHHGETTWTWSPPQLHERDEWFQIQARRFVEALEGREAPTCPLIEAEHTLRVNLAALESAGERRVEIPRTADV